MSGSIADYLSYKNCADKDEEAYTDANENKGTCYKRTDDRGER